MSDGLNRLSSTVLNIISCRTEVALHQMQGSAQDSPRITQNVCLCTFLGVGWVHMSSWQMCFVYVAMDRMHISPCERNVSFTLFATCFLSSPLPCLLQSHLLLTSIYICSKNDSKLKHNRTKITVSKQWFHQFKQNQNQNPLCTHFAIVISTIFNLNLVLTIWEK